MAWSSSATIPDRIFSALAYLLPVAVGLSFAVYLVKLIPGLALVLLPVLPIAMVWNSPILGFILFLGLFMLVVRNDRISYFIRFNVMQAILVDIVLVICQLLLVPLLGVLTQALGSSGVFLEETLYNMVFLGVLGIFVYGVGQSLMGNYANIPTISDAVKSQVR
jgi:hypothetical protein